MSSTQASGVTKKANSSRLKIGQNPSHDGGSRLVSRDPSAGERAKRLLERGAHRADLAHARSPRRRARRPPARSRRPPPAAPPAAQAGIAGSPDAATPRDVGERGGDRFCCCRLPAHDQRVAARRRRAAPRERSLGDQLAAREHHHPVAARLHLGEHVRRQQHRVLAAERAEQRAHLVDLVRDRARRSARRAARSPAAPPARRRAPPAAGSPWTACRSSRRAPRRRPAFSIASSTQRATVTAGDPLQLGAKRQVLDDPHLRVERRLLRQVPDLRARASSDDVVHVEARPPSPCPTSCPASPARMRRVVVLPAPFGPRKPVIDPRGTAKLTSCTARCVP